jgi:Ca2+-binding RTX toxin-like protein
MSATASLVQGVLLVNGGSGNDTIRITAPKTPARNGRVVQNWIHLLDRGNVVARFQIDKVREIVVDGQGGNDLIDVRDLSKPCFLSGGAGNDTLSGSSSYDELRGEQGNDSLLGGAGSDAMLGGAGRDTLIGAAGDDLLIGEEGNDVLDGGLRGADGGHMGNDVLYGGSGSDHLHASDRGNNRLYGEDDDDSLYGAAGHDNLYGGFGGDMLFGGAGNDGLYGGGAAQDSLFGFETDRLIGARGSDRFLLVNGSDDLAVDATAEDALCRFGNAPQITQTFAGQVGSSTYAAGMWNDSEIEYLDLALGWLHQATGNKNLLERLDGTQLTFWRAGAVTEVSGGSFVAAAWNCNDGNIFFADGTFAGSFSAPEIMLHEIAHNFDDEWDAFGWESLSGWTTTDQSQSFRHFMGFDATTAWWYGLDARFVSGYAMTNPCEDFAESFAAYFTSRAGWPSSTFVPIEQISGKYQFIDNMIGALS